MSSSKRSHIRIVFITTSPFIRSSRPRKTITRRTKHNTIGVCFPADQVLLLRSLLFSFKTANSSALTMTANSQVDAPNGYRQPHHKRAENEPTATTSTKHKTFPPGGAQLRSFSRGRKKSHFSSARSGHITCWKPAEQVHSGMAYDGRQPTRDSRDRRKKKRRLVNKHFYWYAVRCGMTTNKKGTLSLFIVSL